MTEFLWNLFEIIVTLFECSISMHFVCKFLGLDFTDKSNLKYWYGIVICYTIAVTVVNCIISYEGIFAFIYSFIVFIYATFFLPDKLIKKAFVSVFFLCVIVMNSYSGVNITSTILNSGAEEIYSKTGFLRLIAVIFVQALNLLVFQILENTIGNGALKLKFREWLLLACTFFLSVLGMTLIQLAVTNINADKILRLCFLGTDFTIIIINYIVIRLITVLNRHHQTELENQQLQLQLQYQTHYAETVRQQEESVHRLRHDLKSTISALHNFIHNNQLYEMEEYINRYDTLLSETSSIVHTNQPFLNAILNTKMTYAKEHGIACIYHSPEILPSINGMDYCSLLGNLLDNAIDASILLAVREISVTIDFTDSILTITVKNRIQNSVLYENPHLNTTKGNNSYHGHGIPTIKEIVKKYNGDVDFYESDGWFNASIVLYIQ
ncbi:MAG: GHKL domain-containing protein [Ruminococcus sp.]|nr:GHKL domain-containing protein [Ruminococcus sp.]